MFPDDDEPTEPLPPPWDSSDGSGSWWIPEAMMPVSSTAPTSPEANYLWVRPMGQIAVGVDTDRRMLAVVLSHPLAREREPVAIPAILLSEKQTVALLEHIRHALGELRRLPVSPVSYE